MWAKDKDCFFAGIYVINEVGEIIGYKPSSYESKRKFIKTNKLLKFRGWELD